MKKSTYLIIFIVLCGVLPSNAQSPGSQAGNLSVGILGGTNIAKMHFPNSQEPEDQRITSLVRFGIGAIIDINFSEHLDIRLEPMYLQKGGNIEEGPDAANQPEGLMKASSIELPVLVQYSFGETVKPYLIAGPTIGYNLGSEISFSLTGLDFVGDMKEITTAFDFGIAFGGGIQVPFSMGKVFVETKYNYGLMNQRKTGTIALTSGSFQIDMDADKEEDKYTNRGLHIMLGIAFHL